jgi:hypothetical protein
MIQLQLETYTVKDTCPVSDAAVRRLTLLSRSSSELKLPPAASPKLEAILEPVIKFVVFADMGHASGHYIKFANESYDRLNY